MLVTTIIDFNVFIDHCKVLLPLNKSVKCTLDNSKYTGYNIWRSKDWSALLYQKTETERMGGPQSLLLSVFRKYRKKCLPDSALTFSPTR